MHGTITMTWTWEMVDERLREAAATAKSLPGARPRGHICQWPHTNRNDADAWLSWVSYGDPDRKYSDERRRPDLRFTPEPGAIDRMDGAFRWLMWLPIADRKLMQAVLKGARYGSIARKMGLKARSTVMRRYRSACRSIARRLNGSS